MIAGIELPSRYSSSCTLSFSSFTLAAATHAAAPGSHIINARARGARGSTQIRPTPWFWPGEPEPGGGRGHSCRPVKTHKQRGLASSATGASTGDVCAASPHITPAQRLTETEEQPPGCTEDRRLTAVSCQQLTSCQAIKTSQEVGAAKFPLKSSRCADGCIWGYREGPQQTAGRPRCANGDQTGAGSI
jgi:hypothetical protein